MTIVMIPDQYLTETWQWAIEGYVAQLKDDWYEELVLKHNGVIQRGKTWRNYPVHNGDHRIVTIKPYFFLQVFFQNDEDAVLFKLSCP